MINFKYRNGKENIDYKNLNSCIVIQRHSEYYVYTVIKVTDTKYLVIDNVGNFDIVEANSFEELCNSNFGVCEVIPININNIELDVNILL